MERGSAMIVALIVVVMVVGVSAAFLVDTAWKSKHADAGRESDEAHLVCEAALERTRYALYHYRVENTYPWDDILFDHADLPLTLEWPVTVDAEIAGVALELELDLSGLESAPPPDHPAHFLGAPMPFGQAIYYVVIRDNDDRDGDPMTDSDGHLLVYVTAWLADGMHRQIEALVHWEEPRFTPAAAILTDGNARFSGTVNVEGTLGRVYANGSVELNGDPTFAVSVEAAGTIDAGSASEPPDGFNEDVPPATIPDVRPQDLEAEATYILRSDGTVLETSSGRVYRGSHAGWSFSRGRWVFSTNRVVPPGVYYVQGDARLVGPQASVAQTMTVIATGSIETSGTLQLRPYLENTLFVAGGDLILAGNASAEYNGVAFAREQIRTQGHFHLQGALVAQNAANQHRLVDSCDFGGTITITYDGAMETAIENPWRSVRVKAMRRLE